LDQLFTAKALLSISLIIYSIILHEIAHGFAALKFGDDTAKHLGRLSLNPISHIDPMGTIVFPLLQYMAAGRVFLGWAKPVPVQTHHLQPRVAGEIVVAVAGVTVNFLIAVLMAVLLGIESLTPRSSDLFDVFVGVLYTNVALMVFNLLPIPPLDGSHVLKQFLPYSVRQQYEQIGFYGTIVLLFLIVGGVLSPITRPVVLGIVNFLVENITERMRGPF
jgi:Zn-dependent protease